MKERSGSYLVKAGEVAGNANQDLDVRRGSDLIMMTKNQLVLGIMKKKIRRR